ncbi:MAG: carbohydrate kinase family protein [Patescibacteria group bacterium]|nr:carbohydrate kinase family protein [Patescibacteria group bacterium]
MDFIAIGSATRDAFFKVNFETVNWPDTPSKKAYVLPVGEKLDVENIFFTTGGNAVNASVTFARQKFKTACVAKVGCDVSGEAIKETLRKEGVDHRLLRCAKKIPTAYSTLILENGERTILGYHGAADYFNKSDLDFNSLKSKWWYVSLAGKSISMFRDLINFSAKNNIAVAFNPTGYHIKNNSKEILSALKNLSFFVLNDEEASLLTGIPFKDEKAVVGRIISLMNGRGIAAITLGPKGVLVSDGRHIYKAGVFKEKEIVDRTGAGDAFGAGFVAALLRKGITSQNLKDKINKIIIGEAIRFASANATSVVEKIGAQPGILTSQQFKKSRWKILPIKEIVL